MKRLILSFGAVVVLLAVAGVLMCALSFFPSDEGGPDVLPDQAVASGGGVVELASDSAARQLREAAERERRSDLVAAGVRALDGLVLEGTAVSPKRLADLVAAEVDYVSAVGFIDQRSVLASGCELVALAVVLDSMGYDAALTDIADHHLKTGIHVATDYLGSPYNNGGGLPPCVADAGNSWLAGRASGRAAHDASGTPFDVVLALTQLGYPVATWTTIGLADPVFVGPVEDGWQWYSPEHCVVVYGVEGNQVLVSDSLEGLVKRDRARFESVYAACGNKALVVL